MSTTRRLHEDFSAYDNYTADTLNKKIEADTKVYEEWNKQGRRGGLIYTGNPSTSAWFNTAATVRVGAQADDSANAEVVHKGCALI